MREDREPRPAVCLTQSGDLLLVAIQGPGDTGVTLAEEAVLLRKLGAWQAMALDGGGSTTAWQQGKLLLPATGGCRAISTALLVVPRPRTAPSSAAAGPAPAAPGLTSATGLTPESAPPASAGQ